MRQVIHPANSQIGYFVRRSRAIMTFSEPERKRCKEVVARFIERRRPPPHIRAKLDIAFRVQGQSIESLKSVPIGETKTEFWSSRGQGQQDEASLEDILAESRSQMARVSAACRCAYNRGLSGDR
jgi:hypothetical protein